MSDDPQKIFFLPPTGEFQFACFFFPLPSCSVGWSFAAVAAIPYLLFTKINYIDFPWGSGNYLEDSAFCALLDINITPQVRRRKDEKRTHGEEKRKTFSHGPQGP